MLYKFHVYDGPAYDHRQEVYEKKASRDIYVFLSLGPATAAFGLNLYFPYENIVSWVPWVKAALFLLMALSVYRAIKKHQQIANIAPPNLNVPLSDRTAENLVQWAENANLVAEMKAYIAASGPITYANVDTMTESLTRKVHDAFRAEYGL